jgi:hypothetical protein
MGRIDVVGDMHSRVLAEPEIVSYCDIVAIGADDRVIL